MLVLMGTFFFLLYDEDKQQKVEEDSGGQTSSFGGVVLLLIYIFSDAFTSNWQGKIFSEHDVRSTNRRALSSSRPPLCRALPCTRPRARDGCHTSARSHLGGECPMGSRNASSVASRDA